MARTAATWTAFTQRQTALYLVFKVVQRLAQNWRTLNGGQNLMTLVVGGCVFEDGFRQRKLVPEPAASAA